MQKIKIKTEVMQKQVEEGVDNADKKKVLEMAAMAAEENAKAKIRIKLKK